MHTEQIIKVFYKNVIVWIKILRVSKQANNAISGTTIIQKFC